MHRFAAPHQELLSFSMNETLVVAGADGSIFFWDRRTQRPLCVFSDTHAQGVTQASDRCGNVRQRNCHGLYACCHSHTPYTLQVAFHPVHRDTLVTGSEDGLVAVFDTCGGLDEDEGFKVRQHRQHADLLHSRRVC